MEDQSSSKKPLTTAATQPSARRLKGKSISTGAKPLCFIWTRDVKPWPEPISGKLLLDELTNVFARFVVLPDWGPQLLALWTVHTYAFHLRDVTAYLGIEFNRKRSGKCAVLAVLNAMANRALVCSHVRPTELFRLIKEIRPTLLVDEADAQLFENDTLRSIVNSGSSRSSGFVLRLAPSSALLPFAPNDEPSHRYHASSSILNPGFTMFSSWCPKAVIAAGRLPDALVNRYVLIRMRRKASHEHCDRLRNLPRYTDSLGRKSVRFVLDHAKAISEAMPKRPADLNDQAADNWEPLLVLADLAGDPWPTLAREAAVGLTATAEK